MDDNIEIEEYYEVFPEPAPVQITTIEPTPLPKKAQNEYNSLIEKTLSKINQLLSEISISNEGFQSHYDPSLLENFNNNSEIIKQWKQNGKDNIEKILQIGKLAKTILNKRNELIGKYPELETIIDKFFQVKEVLEQLSEEFHQLKTEFPELVKERNEIAIEYKELKKEFDQLKKKYRKLYPETIGVNNREALKDLGVVFTSEEKIHSLISTIPYVDNDEIFETLGYILGFVPDGLKHLNFEIWFGSPELLEGFVDRDFDNGITRLTTNGESVSFFHELIHVVGYQNVYLGRLERNFLLYLQEQNGLFFQEDEYENFYYVSKNLINDSSAAVDWGNENVKEFVVEDTGEKLAVSYEVLTYGLGALFFPAIPQYSFKNGLKDVSIYENFVLGILFVGNMLNKDE